MGSMPIRMSISVPGVLEKEACYENGHVCRACRIQYDKYIERAEYEAALLLTKKDDPIGEVIADYDRYIHENGDGVEAFIVPHDVLPNEILDRIQLEWQDHPGRRMTVDELVRFCLQAEEPTDPEE